MSFSKTFLLFSFHIRRIVSKFVQVNSQHIFPSIYLFDSTPVSFTEPNFFPSICSVILFLTIFFHCTNSSLFSASLMTFLSASIRFLSFTANAIITCTKFIQLLYPISLMYTFGSSRSFLQLFSLPLLQQKLFLSFSK